MADAQEKRVAPLELFFDLVFVFAITQVTALMADRPTWTGLGHGMLVLAALWWAWAAYAWLTNYIAAEEDRERLLMLAVMGAFLVAALAVPEAFGEHALLFAIAYAAARWLHIFIFAEANDDVDAGEAIRRLSRTALPAPLLLIGAAFLDSPAREVVWVLALSTDFLGPYIFGVRGFRVSPAHFAERFSLIVIIALGESIVSIGVGAEGVTLDARTIIAAVLAVTLASAMWWMYFDVVAILAAQKLEELQGVDRTRLARDSYAVLHFFLIAGIILVALAIKKTIGHPEEHLKEIPAVALGLGLAFYSGGLATLRKRDMGRWNRYRLFAAAVALALIPVFKQISALASLTTAAAVLVILVAVEFAHYREARARIRETAA
jgi:low temperature requirement protein LtrA